MPTNTENLTPAGQPSGLSVIALLGSFLPLDGWYIVRPPVERGGKDECAFVRLDCDKQEYVLDVVGQERRYSEELKRYQGWLFWPVAMPNVTDETRAGERTSDPSSNGQQLSGAGLHEQQPRSSALSLAPG